MLIDGMQGAAGAIHTGGDAGAESKAICRRRSRCALFSGVVKLDAQGKRAVCYEICPRSTDGAADRRRLVQGQGRVGSGGRDRARRGRRRRDLPRFLNVGDGSGCMSTSTMSRATRATARFDLDIHGPLTADAEAMTKTVRLDARERRSASMPITAAGVGAAELDLRLTGPKTDLTQRLARDRLWRAGRLPAHDHGLAPRREPDRLGRSRR